MSRAGIADNHRVPDDFPSSRTADRRRRRSVHLRPEHHELLRELAHRRRCTIRELVGEAIANTYSPGPSS